MPIKNLSVFFPLYNEEGNVRQAVEKCEKVLKKLKIDYEILLIDDGSKDNTAKIVDQIAKENSHVQAIHHQKNLGYGEALKSGFYNAKYEVIVYTDGDGQFDFSEVEKFLKEIETNDLVIGYRIKRQDPFFRILFKKGWQLSLWTFFGLTLKDVDCGFKMIRREVLEKIPHLESQRGAMINAEIAIKAKKGGFNIAQVGVNHYPRLSGKPTGANLNVILRSFLDLFRLWWKLKDQKHLFVLLLAVLLLAAFLRFYKLDEYMTFLGDEGRDALIVKDILTGVNFPLIGPPTSVGNIYLGPLYYYMMAIPMGIFYLNPVAAAGMNALIGVLTVGLIYYLGKVWFGRVAGLIAAFLYAISPVAITYSRSSWNPNPAPFFALIGFFALFRMHKSGNLLWLILVGLSFAASVQMHYLAIILIPVGGILWLYEILSRRKGGHIKNLISGTILGIIAFLLLMSPLFIFDLKHDFLNYKATVGLLTQSGEVGGNLFGNISRVPFIYSYNLIGRYLAGGNVVLTIILSVLVIVALFRKTWSQFALGIWLFVGLLGISFYQSQVYDHYLGFMNPAVFLLLGSVFALVKTRTLKALSIIIIIVMSIINLSNSPLKSPPNNQLKRTQEITKFIIGQTNGRPFNFALLAKSNYDSAYQFYLEEYGHKPKQVPFEKTDQLFVVCEDQVCDPIYSPKYEIAAFGWTLVDKMWEVNGLKVFKLVQNPEQFK
ncbi:hypothetical protein A3B45_03370 [Candidatus Daviesbacteria bacterium RIFCSPLOWO2_01_FULL_39_12]|uniref:Glycosyltransferase 2-like domain-containing protein n=1 Tax=Candidatus Daviesbacteria bacterium RIFCSPLOWO2_01_FULL_39_12 TaxID=1797785 RepID=A0A1F5KSV8_9BACT|nr:MAG: hypothetical protein A3D79_03395 [Candidatus Daviesbacteria bacterium RIFCSPHIGHO2_02_FULL_39_8]OGE43701.1 MAG: hypothetical protein A3B45_03370 [Candidatus Daviesbacteria bacterium RIFCSPLOWO2_01_FULL_39_12]